ncbi:conserved hypothetical protein (plasmid) [Thioalkalivibrio sp. K90mix]|nr:conserved hypothetical protein [Thioalkalivibrio sp. K90mix]
MSSEETREKQRKENESKGDPAASLMAKQMQRIGREDEDPDLETA